MTDLEPFTATLTCPLCGKTFSATVPIIDLYQTAMNEAYSALHWHTIAWCDGVLRDRVSLPDEAT